MGKSCFLMLLHFLGSQSMSLGLCHVPRTQSLMPAIEGAHGEAPAWGEKGVWCGSQDKGAAVPPLHLYHSLAVSFYTDPEEEAAFQTTLLTGAASLSYQGL